MRQSLTTPKSFLRSIFGVWLWRMDNNLRLSRHIFHHWAAASSLSSILSFRFMNRWRARSIQEYVNADNAAGGERTGPRLKSGIDKISSVLVSLGILPLARGHVQHVGLGFRDRKWFCSGMWPPPESSLFSHQGYFLNLKSIQHMVPPTSFM